MRSAFVPFVAFALALAALPAQSQDKPKRKPGLWEIKALSGTGTPPRVMQQCTDDAFETQLLKQGQEQAKALCSKSDMRREGDRIVSDSVCKMGVSTVTSQSITTGDFSRAYRVEVKSTISPPIAGQQSSSGVIEARWLGPCLPGQKPGEMVVPGMPTPKSK